MGLPMIWWIENLSLRTSRPFCKSRTGIRRTFSTGSRASSEEILQHDQPRLLALLRMELRRLDIPAFHHGREARRVGAAAGHHGRVDRPQHEAVNEIEDRIVAH